MTMAKDMPKVELGFRLQSAMSFQDFDRNGVEDESSNDIYLRRLRLEVTSKFRKDFKFYMDIRNDKIGKLDKGDGEFTVGDAYLQYKISPKLKLKFHRAKVDLSRTQTVSSSRLLFHDRTRISDFAANFVSDGRRATNIQLNGELSPKVNYHLVLGKGVESADLEDAKGNSATKMTGQNYMVGGKIKLSPFEDWKEGKLAETHFGSGKHFTFGVGYFETSNIHFDTDLDSYEVDRSLLNIELSFHYDKFSFASEYFVFDGVAEDFNNQNFETGKAEGYYAQIETFINKNNTHSLILRYENFDQYEKSSDFEYQSIVLGTSYYIEGNDFKVGAFIESNDYGRALDGPVSSLEKEVAIKLTSQLNY